MRLPHTNGWKGPTKGTQRGSVREVPAFPAPPPTPPPLHLPHPLGLSFCPQGARASGLWLRGNRWPRSKRLISQESFLLI